MPHAPLYELTPAESIFAPFYEERIVPEMPLQSTAHATGFRWETNWDSTAVQWDDAKPGSLAGNLTLSVGTFPEHFDHYIFCTVLPKGVVGQFWGASEQ